MNNSVYCAFLLAVTEHRQCCFIPNFIETTAELQVPLSVVTEVLNESELVRYNRFALRSYVEDNRKMEWCPAPDCEHAVECLVDVGEEPLDVTCSCGCSFCFTCKEEAHRPVSVLRSSCSEHAVACHL